MRPHRGYGLFSYHVFKKERKQTIGEICIGLGLLFIVDGDAAKSYTTLPAFKDLFASLVRTRFWVSALVLL